MRGLTLTLCLAALACGAAPSRADLRVEGETLTVVTKLPFKVVCSDDALLYLWDVPAGWKTGPRTGKVLEVLEAPEGQAAVGLQVAAVAEGKPVRREYALKVNVGKVGPPPPPPPSDDPLVRTFQAAYDALTSEAGTRAADLAALAATHGQAAKVTCRDPSLTTYSALTATVHKAIQGQIGARLTPLREAIAAEKRKLFPSNPGAALDAAGRDRAAAFHARIAAALEGVRP